MKKHTIKYNKMELLIVFSSSPFFAFIKYKWQFIVNDSSMNWKKERKRRKEK